MLKVAGSIPSRGCTDLYYAHFVLWGTKCDLYYGGTAHKVGWPETSQLDLTSLTPLSVAGCGGLQPGAPQ